MKRSNPLPKVLKAVASFASKDSTRPALQVIRAPSPSEIVATDGHTLIRVRFDYPHGLASPSSYEPSGTVKLAAAGVEAAALISILDPLPFPAYQAVIPAFTSEGSSERIRAMNPGLMARAFDALNEIARAYSVKSPSVRIQAPEDAGAPLRVDMRVDLAVRVTVLIMPMRYAESDYSTCAEAPEGKATAAA